MEKIQISILTAEKVPWGICDEVSAMSSLEPGIIIRLLEKNPLFYWKQKLLELLDYR